MTEYLSQKGLRFERIDIRADPGAIEELMRMGIMATPALVIDAQVLVGFDPARIDRAVAAVL